eukprot:5676628-Amphidinium_carterae.1
MESFMKSVFEIYGLQKSIQRQHRESNVQVFLLQEMSNCVSQITIDSKLQWANSSVWQQSDQTSSLQPRCQAAHKIAQRYSESSVRNCTINLGPGSQLSALNFTPTVTQPEQVVQSSESQLLWSASIVHNSRTQSTVPQSSAEAEHYALTSATNDLIHIQSVIMKLGIINLVESGVITVPKIGTQNNPSDILTKFMPPSTLNRTVSVKSAFSNFSSSSTPKLDTKTPKSRKSMKDNSAPVSTQEAPGTSEPIQTCCKCNRSDSLRRCEISDCQRLRCHLHTDWIARDAVNSQWCCHCCLPRSLKCCSCHFYLSVRMLDAVILSVAFTHNGVPLITESGVRSVAAWPTPMIRIRGNSSIDLT